MSEDIFRVFRHALSVCIRGKRWSAWAREVVRIWTWKWGSVHVWNAALEYIGNRPTNVFDTINGKATEVRTSCFLFRYRSRVNQGLTSRCKLITGCWNNKEARDQIISIWSEDGYFGLAYVTNYNNHARKKNTSNPRKTKQISKHHTTLYNQTATPVDATPRR